MNIVIWLGYISIYLLIGSLLGVVVDNKFKVDTGCIFSFLWPLLPVFLLVYYIKEGDKK